MTTTTRRLFIQTGLSASGALMVGLMLPACRQPEAKQTKSTLKTQAASAPTHTTPFLPNAWITIKPDNTVEFVLDRVEMGQGTTTSHAMMIAEELDVDPSAIVVVYAKAENTKASKQHNLSVTGGSSSVRRSWMSLRTGAATAKMVLLEAAATTWGVKAASCITKNGQVSHPKTGRSMTYGALAKAAASMTVPTSVTLKDPAAFSVIGKDIPRLDARTKIDGTAVYGLDVQVPNLLNALVIRPPDIGGRVKSFDSKRALKQRGVKAVVAISSGVAIVAEKYWQALAARDLVEVQWRPGPAGTLDSDKLSRRLVKAFKTSGDVIGSQGNWSSVKRKTALSFVEATYEQPFLAHATLEPQNCTAHHKGDSCEVWAPTQGVGYAQRVAAQAARLPANKVTVHQTMLGGGFGRRIAQDYVKEAVELSRQIKAPVKVIWTRSDDTQHDHYRPQSLHQLRGAFDKQGRIQGWRHAIASPSSTLSMGADELLYGVPHIKSTLHTVSSAARTGYWRSVGHSNNGFVVEGFIDELLVAAKQDPYLGRRALLSQHPRARRVLDLAAKHAKWGNAPRGVFQGIAQHPSFGSFCAHVVEIEYPNGKNEPFVIKRVVCAVDCGLAINPDIIRAQVEGSVAFALSAALYQQIQFKQGAVQQANFNTFPLLRMAQMPQVDVLIAKSTQSPTGIGEVGVPTVSPALTNAIFAATGKRIRRLPIFPVT